jgi:hypothetical protein
LPFVPFSIRRIEGEYRPSFSPSRGFQIRDRCELNTSQNDHDIPEYVARPIEMLVVDDLAMAVDVKVRDADQRPESDRVDGVAKDSSR